MFVRLSKDWPGNFRRTVRDAKGEAVSILEWSPQDEAPMEVTDPLELAAIKGDLGKALMEVKPPAFKPEKSVVVPARKDIEHKPADEPPNPLKVQGKHKGA